MDTKKDYKIYPVKLDEDKLNCDTMEKYPLNPSTHLHLCVGRVKAGKSLLCSNLYLSERFYGNDFKHKILISTTAYNDAVNKYMIEDFDFVFTDYTDDLLEEIIDMVKEDDTPDKWLIIFDDIINSSQTFKRAGKTDGLTKLITTYRHIGTENHEGKLSVCICVQYFKYLSPIARNNCSGYFILGHYPQSEIKKMSEALSIFGRDDKGFLNIYNESRKDDYDFLYLSVEHLEARRNIEHLLWSHKEGFTFNTDGDIDKKLNADNGNNEMVKDIENDTEKK